MNTTTLEKKFESMGARLKVSEPARNQTFTIDIRRDEEGPYFDIKAKDDVNMEVLDVQKGIRHLLLSTTEKNDRHGMDKAKFLCGFDERDWFTCAIPKPVSSVFQAMQALKPEEVVDFEKSEGIRRKNMHKRHRRLNSGKKIHRQGEFMFVPAEGFEPPTDSLTVIHRNEPMMRGGKPHRAEYLFRQGGQTVYVSNYSDKARNGLTQKEYEKLPDDERIKHNWRRMTRDATVYVKGRITHSDHKTVDLKGLWHRATLNTENRAAAAKRVAFLD